MSLTDFTSSNLLRFDSPIAYRIDLPLGLPPRFRSTEPNFFVVKQDPLGFVLDLGNINELLTGVFVYFAGTVINENDGIISWQMDNNHLPESQRPVGKTILGYRITSVDGQLTTSLTDITPVVGTSNISGENRLYRTLLNFIGNQNILNIEVNSGIALTASVHILSAAARCGVNVPSFMFGVDVHYDNWRGDGCGHRYLMIDEMVRFTAGVHNVVSLGRPIATRFSWEFSWLNDEGGWDLFLATSPPSDSPYHDFLPDRTGSLKIKAIVDITTDSTAIMENGLSSFEFRMMVQNEETLGFANAICELRHNIAGLYAILAPGVGAGFTVGGIRFIDPLWDPNPEISINVSAINHPYTLQQLQQIHRNMERSVKFASGIMAISSKLIEKQKIKTIDSIEKQMTNANNQASKNLKKNNEASMNLNIVVNK